MKYLKFSFILALSLFVLSSCDNDDDPMVESNTIVDIAAADAQFSTLVSALQRTGLDAILNAPGNFTVFAPTNDAFDQLGVDLGTLSNDELAEILLYHVLGASVRSTDLQDGLTYASTASTSGPNDEQLTLLIDNDGGSVTVNGSVNVSSVDITAQNGVIHVVDDVIMPLNVVGHAVANPGFSTLVEQLGSAPGDLVSTLSSTGPFTVFAPTNEAFEQISDVVATLTPEQIADVLTYHVIAGSNVRSTDLTNGAEVMTVNGQTITIDLTSGAQIIDAGGNASNIVLTDVQATNGVIHVIESVIVPSL